jgi:hypothetical protein
MNSGKMRWLACVTALVAGLMGVAGAWSQQVYYGNANWLLGDNTRIVSVNLIDGKLHVEKRQASNITYCEGGHPPDAIWKEIYAASNGVVVLERKVEGTVVPAQTTPERVEWPDVESRKTPPSPWASLTNMTNLVTSNFIMMGTGTWDNAVIIGTNTASNAANTKVKDSHGGK